VCDISPLDVCDVFFGQPYMWKFHGLYESRPGSIIITVGGELYRIPKVVLNNSPPKEYDKVIFDTPKFILFIVCSKHAQNTTTTIAISTPFIQQR
jgi:hypothetical protein